MNVSIGGLAKTVEITSFDSLGDVKVAPLSEPFITSTPTFSKTSGDSSFTKTTFFQWGHVCQLMLQIKTQSANVGDTMLAGTFTGIPLPTGNGIGSNVLVGGAVIGCRLTDLGAFTVRLGGLNYTAPSGGGTSYISIIYLTA